MNKQKILFIALFLITCTSATYACGGSCVECHSKLAPLIKDKDHDILNTCTTCHTKHSENGQCGQDCFECHTKEKLYSNVTIKEHQALKACAVCHAEKTNFISPKQSISPSQNTLIQMIK